MSKQNEQSEESLKLINDRELKMYATDLLKLMKMLINQELTPEFNHILERVSRHPNTRHCMLQSYITETDNVFVPKVVDVQQYYIRPFGFGYANLGPQTVIIH